MFWTNTYESVKDWSHTSFLEVVSPNIQICTGATYAIHVLIYPTYRLK